MHANVTAVESLVIQEEIVDLIQHKWNTSSVKEEVSWPENAEARELLMGMLHPIKQGKPLSVVSAHTIKSMSTLTQPPYATQAAYLIGKIGKHMVYSDGVTLWCFLFSTVQDTHFP